ncbi:DUF11 domain-containing protein [Kitasatospora sp. CB01950]|uniref:DUF11 domain-containing protein n=1 Tax=Kitasatospora sp. CB01950 TaxID=1703930 RepID=UPI00093F8DDB|nr:DUF11 domain-containing protein [Kitasatospora sp. CB01950]
MARRWWVGLIVAGGLGAASLPLLGPPQVANAAAGDPFPVGPGLVFVAQGPARGEPTTLYEAVQGPGQITFVKQGTAAFGYNAMGFHLGDQYLYAINDNGGLVRIGQGGVGVNYGQVGLPSSSANYNQGTFGQGPTGDLLYVRLATANSDLYAVNVVSRTTTHIALSSSVPNLSDFVWAQGYLWGVYGEGGRIYRIDPTNGNVISFASPKLPANPYGAQWVYGNGNIGISNNVTGTVYQLQLVNPTSANPSAILISSTRGPSNSQNDGASYPGQPVDLAIAKSGPAEWTPHQTISYTLTVTNNGPGDSSGYVVNDVLPDTVLNPTTSTAGCEITVDDDGHHVLQCAGAALGAGNSADITVTGTAPAVAGTDCTTDGITNSTTVIGNEQDPDLTNNTATSTACPAGTPVPSFTIGKTASIAAPNFAGPGDRVTYTVTVTNTGAVDYTAANPASFTDNLADVLDDATLDPASLTGGAQSVNGSVTWSGPLAVGATHTVTYAVVVNNPGTGNHVLRNAAVPGGTGSCAETCTQDTPVAEFSLSKSATPTSVSAGGVVTYTLTVTNTGAVPFGNGPDSAPPAHVTDDLTNVLDNAAYNNDASNGGTLTGNTLAWDVSLPVGDTLDLTYSVTANPNVRPNATLTNLATPGRYGHCTSAADCTTSTPVQPLTRSFTVAKQASASSAAPGDTVTYTVTVTNTGDADFTAADPASFTDNLTDVLDDATYNNDATNGATVTGNTLTWSGPLAAGATTTITYSVTVNDPDTGNHRLQNLATPGEHGTCTTAADCTTTTTVQGFTIAKTVSSATAAPGDKVTYTVTVTNNGTVDFTAADPASFTDDLTDVLDDATYNNDATNGATVTGNTLSWSGPLAAGATTTVTYSFAVNNPDTGNRKLTNLATPGRHGTCTSTADCTTTTNLQSFTIAKTVSSATAAPGDKVTYTVTVTNTGTADIGAANPASFTDDLTDVLDDATYNNDATNGATVTGNTLTWSGPLAAGAGTTVTYSFTVNNPVQGNGKLHNTATPGEPGTCASTCATETTVNQPSPGPSPTPKPTKPAKPEQEHDHGRLPETGSDLALPAAAAAGSLVLLGGGLIWWRRKGQRH